MQAHSIFNPAESAKTFLIEQLRIDEALLVRYLGLAKKTASRLDLEPADNDVQKLFYTRLLERLNKLLGCNEKHFLYLWENKANHEMFIICCLMGDCIFHEDLETKLPVDQIHQHFQIAAYSGNTHFAMALMGLANNQNIQREYVQIAIRANNLVLLDALLQADFVLYVDQELLELGAATGNFAIYSRLQFYKHADMPTHRVLRKAARSGQIDIVMLLAKQLPVTHDLMHEAAKSGNVELLKRLHAEPFNLPYDQTCLYHAIYHDKLAATQFLLEQETTLVIDKLAFINVANCGNETLYQFLKNHPRCQPIIFTKADIEEAICEGLNTVAQDLVRLSGFSGNNDTVLVTAAKTGKMELVKNCLEEGHRPTHDELIAVLFYMSHKFTRDAIKLGLRTQFRKIIKLFCYNLSDRAPGTRALTLSARAGDLELVRAFMLPPYNITPIMETLKEAAESGNYDIVAMLLDPQFELVFDSDMNFQTPNPAISNLLKAQTHILSAHALWNHSRSTAKAHLDSARAIAPNFYESYVNSREKPFQLIEQEQLRAGPTPSA